MADFSSPGAAPGGGVVDDELLLFEEGAPAPEPEPEPGGPRDDGLTSLARTAATTITGPLLSASAYPVPERGCTVEEELDEIQGRLHDAAAIWSRAELLRLYNDAYRQLCALSGAVRRWRPTDLPGRHTFGITQEWESASSYRGTVRKPTHAVQSERLQGINLWETEAIEGVTPTNSLDGHTQDWERAYRDGGSDLHYQFSFPRNHQRVIRLQWQNRKLHPVGVRDLDDSNTRWFTQMGEPRWWTTGIGRVRSVELYEVASTYHQAYQLPTTAEGIARGFSGERTWGVDVPHENPTAFGFTSQADIPSLLGLGARITMTPISDVAPIHAWESDLLNGETALMDSATIGTYAWEHAFGAERVLLAVGQARSVLSNDRQYLPVTSDATLGSLLGRIVDWRSSEDSVFALEVVVPDTDLAESDVPTLIPPQMMKYLRYYVFSRAFGRPGEGRQPILADFYGRRFQRGVELFRSFGNIARHDRVYQREAMMPARKRPAYVRLPAEFPSPWG